MPALYQKYREFKHGVINAIEPSEIPHDAAVQSDKFWYRENYWRKIPGLVEIHDTAIGSNPVWSTFVFHKFLPNQVFIMAASGGDLLKFDPGPKTWTSVHGGLVANQQVEFLEDRNVLFFGSQQDEWRKFDGGSRTYKVGGANPPKKFINMVFNPYAGRYFGIGDLKNPDYLQWSAHISTNGVEDWPDSNIQIVQSTFGDTPIALDIFEGRIIMASKHSINTGTVIGVPENWSFQREKASAGTIAQRTFKRYGNSFFMLTPEFELYRWPDDKFVSKGRVKFEVEDASKHLAWAEIVEDRYYYLCFRHSRATTKDNYHLWIYDILGDRFYGPHTQFNLASAYYDRETKKLLCGGTADLEGFVMEHRGTNIKNNIMNCDWIGAFSDYGFPRVEKHYTKIWMKSKQEGSLPGGEGQVELIVSVDNNYSQVQAQRLVLEDPSNFTLADTSHVKEAITKHAYIYDDVGRGNAIQVRIKHAVRNGTYAFSEFDIEYFLKKYTKKDRGS